MAAEQRCAVRFLAYGASLRDGSPNDKLATLATVVVEER